MLYRLAIRRDFLDVGSFLLWGPSQSSLSSLLSLSAQMKCFWCVCPPACVPTWCGGQVLNGVSSIVLCHFLPVLHPSLSMACRRLACYVVVQALLKL